MAYTASVSAALLAVLLAIPVLLGDFVAYQIGLFLIYGIVGQGIGFLWGRTGILPFGQAAFFGLSAYATAHVLMAVPGLFTQIALLTLIIFTAAIVAFVLASLVFKGRNESGPFFSLITLALAMIVEQVAGTGGDLTGGFNGLSGFATLGGLDPFNNLYFLIAGAVVASTALLLTLDRLPAGLLARAVADNEMRLQLLGFPTHLLKGLAFALSAAFAAVAGILFANHQGIVTPTSTGFLLSASFVIWTAVGGRYHVLGPLIGAVGIGYLTAELRDSFVYWEVVLALIFILVVLRAPDGFAGYLDKGLKRIIPKSTLPPPDAHAPPAVRAQGPSQPLTFESCKVQVGPVHILNGVELRTPAQGIVCIIGPNGAGKTSLLNVVTGGLPLLSGTIDYGGSAIQNCPPYAALRSGIGRKLQVPSVFSTLTVADNLCIAMLARRARLVDFFRTAPRYWRSEGLDRLLDTPALPLKSDLGRPVSDLPQGHRQFLEFAMTTASDPQVLLLDEPCAGLSPSETALMTDLVREFQKTHGGLVLLIEHDMSIVKALATHIVVMHQGAVLAQGTYDEVSADADVQSVYAGGTK